MLYGLICFDFKIAIPWPMPLGPSTSPLNKWAKLMSNLLMEPTSGPPILVTSGTHSDCLAKYGPATPTHI